MTRDEFQKLSEVDQQATIATQGEVLINLRQGVKNVTLYRIGNFLVKGIYFNEKSHWQIINEADVPTLFQSS